MKAQLCWSPDGHGSEAEDRRGGNADRRDQAAGETTTRLRGAWLTDEVALHKRRAYLSAARSAAQTSTPLTGATPVQVVEKALFVPDGRVGVVGGRHAAMIRVC